MLGTTDMTLEELNVGLAKKESFIEQLVEHNQVDTPLCEDAVEKLSALEAAKAKKIDDPPDGRAIDGACPLDPDAPEPTPRCPAREVGGGASETAEGSIASVSVSVQTEDPKTSKGERTCELEHLVMLTQARVRELEAALNPNPKPPTKPPPLEVTEKTGAEWRDRPYTCPFKFRPTGSYSEFTMCTSDKAGGIRFQRGACNKCKLHRVNPKHKLCRGYFTGSTFCDGFAKTRREGNKHELVFVAGKYCKQACADKAASLMHDNKYYNQAFPEGFRPTEH